jgi:peptide deformylase
MFQLMYRSNGVGLAATQIGMDYQFAVMNPTGSAKSQSMEKVIINPEIISIEGSDKQTEGCLSLPTIRGKITRPTKIEVKYINLDGETVTESIQGFAARIFMHEFEHLDGMLITDKMSPADLGFNGRSMKILEQHAKMLADAGL